jgi:hypothetical protein
MAAATAILLASVLAAGGTPAAAPGPFDHVLLVSVDGLRPDAIDGPEDGPLPAFGRLMKGPHTLQARTDPDLTITLPNHVSMVTSRPVGGPLGHGWTENGDPPAVRHGGTVHKRRGTYVASMFDVAHDRGVATAVIATKSKFSLLAQSFDDENGAPDAHGADDGRCKVDLLVTARTSDDALEMALARLRTARGRSLSLVHFGVPDFVGHSLDWDMQPGSPYRKAVAEVDGALLRLLAAIDGDPAIRGRVAIILTADHGGGVPQKTHTKNDDPLNFLVPFIVWLGADGEPHELSALNGDRRAALPASQWAPREMEPPPIRTAEAGNLALHLMGLPPIPGSVANAIHDLRVAPPANAAPGAAK